MLGRVSPQPCSVLQRQLCSAQLRRARLASRAPIAAAMKSQAQAISVFERTYPLPSGCSFTVATFEREDGAQEVVVSTDKPGRILLVRGTLLCCE